MVASVFVLGLVVFFLRYLLLIPAEFFVSGLGVS